MVRASEALLGARVVSVSYLSIVFGRVTQIRAGFFRCHALLRTTAQQPSPNYSGNICQRDDEFNVTTFEPFVMSEVRWLVPAW